jgi:exodeoxyribonuclease VII small subunit
LIVGPRDGSLAGAATWSLHVSSNNKFNLEKSLAALEELVEELESGDLPLEKAMKKFEDGIKLTRGCQTALKEAEQKVEVLLQSAGGEELEEFEADES